MISSKQAPIKSSEQTEKKQSPPTIDDVIKLKHIWSDEELAHKVIDAEKQLGQNDGFMLVERPEFKAKKKVRENAVFENYPEAAQEDDLDVDELVSQAVAEAEGTPPPENKTAPPPPPPSPPSGGGGTPPPGGGGGPIPNGSPPTSDDQDLQKRWKRPFFVDYLKHIKPYPDLLPVMVKDKGMWQFPPLIANIRIVLKHSRHPKLPALIRENKLTGYVEVNGRQIEDNDLTDVKMVVDNMWGRDVAKERIKEAVESVARDNAYEPVQDWLLSLPAWDGTDRWPLVVNDILKVPNPQDVHYHMFRHFMTGIAARTMKPGCKFDTILFLVGGQGEGKSTFFQMLIDGQIDEKIWFSDEPIDLWDSDSKALISRKTVVEWSEGEHAKSPKMRDKVKSFLSQTEDEFRSPYKAYSVKRPRRCVFVGTSNDNALLHDETGHRRFYVMRVGVGIDHDLLLQVREQLFAQALHHFNAFLGAKKGTPDWNANRWWFRGQGDVARGKVVAEFQSRSVWFDNIGEWVEGRRGLKHPEFTLSDVLENAVKMPRDRKKKQVEALVRGDLKQLGCKELGNIHVNGRRGRFWAPPEAVPGPDDDLPY
jgi:hypothetical protein